MKVSSKTALIIILLAVVALLLFFPMFGKPSILGMTIAKVYVKPLEVNNTCNVSLYKGWNLFSIACQASNVSVTNLLQPLEGNYSSIYRYNGDAQLDKWNVYNPNLPGWVVQDLTDLNVEEGYWINMVEDDVFYLYGSITLPRKISLGSGWRLVGHPTNTSKDPATAFTTISGSYSIVWGYNASSGNYLYYIPGMGGNTLSIIEPGSGYWVNMTSGDDWWVT